MKPYRYQQDALERIKQLKNRGLIAFDTGLGKTPFSLWNLKETQAYPAVVVCPASVKYQWQREAKLITGTRGLVLEGRKAIIPPTTKHQLWIINYDILASWVDFLREQKVRTVILDEAQYCANPQAKRTKAAMKLCRGVQNILALSATPILNRPIELWPVVNLLAPDTFPNGFKFKQRYCKPKWTPWGWQYKGASHTSELHQLLTSSMMIRYTKEEVLPDLPKETSKMIPLPIIKRAEYAEADTDIVSWLAKTDNAKALRISRAVQMARVGELLRLASRLKLKYTVEWLNQYLSDTDEKLIVFAIHRKVIATLREECNFGSVVIDGSVTGQKRFQAVKQFQDDPNTRILFGNIKAAGMGIDGVQKVCSTAVFVELPWEPGLVIQAKGRINRIGQTRPTMVYYLVAYDTLEETLCRVLQSKQDIVTTVLDGGKGETLSLFDLLLKRLKKPSVQ
jgi:SNF2 family DNA or RNA helicase